MTTAPSMYPDYAMYWLVHLPEGWCFSLLGEAVVQLEHADRTYFTRRSHAVETAEQHGLHVGHDGSTSYDAPEQHQW
jgi:hypothetical protein